MAKSEQQSASILTDLGQIPINAYYYCRLKTAARRTAREQVVLLTLDFDLIGTFEVTDPSILACMTEVVRDEDRARGLKLKPLRDGFTVVVRPPATPKR